MLEQIGEGGELEKRLAVGWAVDNFMLEDPGEIVGHEDGVQAGGKRGVDVRARRVADHPRIGTVADVAVYELTVGGLFLFGEDFNCREERLEAGALQLVGLLFEVALGDEDAAVALAEVFQGFGDVGEQLDFGHGDGLGEGDDASVFFRRDFGISELFEAGNERAPEALETVAVLGDGGALAEVEMLADFFVGMDTMIEVGDEGGDGAFKVNVVLPERVVGVEEKCLLLEFCERLGHIRIIKSRAESG